MEEIDTKTVRYIDVRGIEVHCIEKKDKLVFWYPTVPYVNNGISNWVDRAWASPT